MGWFWNFKIDIPSLLSYNSYVENFEWNDDKNEKLKEERGISFEMAVKAILNSNLVKIEKNPSKKHLNQLMHIININNYCYLVPFVREKDKIFLKTIIPSRKATKKYIKNLSN